MQAQHLDELRQSKARCAVVADDMTIPDGLLDAYIVVSRPRYALAILSQLFAKAPQSTPAVHPSAVIEASARIADTASIGALCYIGENCVIGEGVRVMPQVTIAAGSIVG